MEPDINHIKELEILFNTLPEEELKEIHEQVKKFINENQNHLNLQTKSKLKEMISVRGGNYDFENLQNIGLYVGVPLIVAIMLVIAWYIANDTENSYEECRYALNDKQDNDMRIKIKYDILIKDRCEGISGTPIDISKFIEQVTNKKVGVGHALPRAMEKHHPTHKYKTIRTHSILSDPNLTLYNLIINSEKPGNMIIFLPNGGHETTRFLEGFDNFEAAKNHYKNQNITLIDLSGFTPEDTVSRSAFHLIRDALLKNEEFMNWIK
jgi:hypothetical protein